jgi:hypothetical protein
MAMGDAGCTGFLLLRTPWFVCPVAARKNLMTANCPNSVLCIRTVQYCVFSGRDGLAGRSTQDPLTLSGHVPFRSEHSLETFHSSPRARRHSCFN